MPSQKYLLASPPTVSGTVGTTLSWRIKDADGSVLVSFEHDGWKEAPPEMISQSWKHFLGSLKSYVETGSGQPW